MKVASWEKVYCSGTIPGPRHVSGVGLLESNKLVVYGGYGPNAITYNDCYVCDLHTMEWKPVVFPSSQKQFAIHSFSTVVRKGLLYLYGGVSRNGRDVCNSNEIIEISIDPPSRRVIETSGVHPSRSWGHSAVVYNDRMYVFGGYGATLYNDLYCYDFESCSWIVLSTKGSIPRKRHFHSAFVHEDKMYIIGGYAMTCQTADMYVYSFRENTWSRVSDDPLLTKRRSHTSVVRNDKVYTIGGRRNMNIVEYDLKTHEVQSFVYSNAKDPDSRYFHNSFVWEGDMYILFGFDNYNIFDMTKITFGDDTKVNKLQQHSTAFKHLLGSETLSDISLLVDDRIVHAHKFILYSMSPYFQGMFESNMKESRATQILIENVSYKTVWSILEYIYTGATQITSENILEIYKASDLFLMDDLKCQCHTLLTRLIPTLSPLALKEILEFALVYDSKIVTDGIFRLSQSNHHVIEETLGLIDDLETKTQIATLLNCQ